jgi:hypothetical protein
MDDQFVTSCGETFTRAEGALLHEIFCGECEAADPSGDS